jgi:alcohol dehydrogenase
VWRISRAGSLTRLRKVSDVLPRPGRGEARVRVEAIGLNFADIFACLGLYSATPEGAFIPGLELAGVIEEIGPADASTHESPRLRAGEAVMGVTRFGAYATAANVRVQALARIPPGWTATQAAAFPVQGLTAWYGLIELARVQQDELVLLHSAAGGVGLFALGILRAMGARIVATVGKEEKRRFLVERYRLPPELVILRDRRRFADQLDRALQALNAKGFDVVFDAVAGAYFQPALRRLRPRGRLVIYGGADFMPHGFRLAADPRVIFRYLRRPRIDPLSLINRNRSVLGFNLIWLWDQVDRLPEAYTSLRRLCPEPPLVGQRFPFDDAAAAMRFLQNGQSIGKVVLDVSASPKGRQSFD